MKEHPDAILVEHAVGGEQAAYGELVRRYSRRVFAVCLGMLANTHNAEDVAQQALIRGFEKIRELKEPEQFGAWITRIAQNLCIDFQRRKKSEELDEGLKNEKNPAHDRYSDLHEALEKLPEEYRLPLVLYYFNGESTAKLAEVLNLSPAGVLTRLSRARAKLREILRSFEGG